MHRLKNKRTIIAIAAALVTAAFAGLIVANIYVSDGYFSALKEANAARVSNGTLKQRFAMLSRQHSNQCALASNNLAARSRNDRLQGSCCTAMVYREYVRQIH